jgi:hypothetical protein
MLSGRSGEPDGGVELNETQALVCVDDVDPEVMANAERSAITRCLAITTQGNVVA